MPQYRCIGSDYSSYHYDVFETSCLRKIGRENEATRSFPLYLFSFQ